MSIKIKQISNEKVWLLRHKIMYPDRSFEFIKLSKDDEGIHFGLFANEKLVSVVSLFIENNKAQFRKLATEIEEQGKGYGTRLLNYVFEQANAYNVKSIWCNARTKKLSFYKKFDMLVTDKTYTKMGIDFVIMEKSVK